MPSDLYQLVYRSSFRSGRVANTLQALREIVKASNRNNRASGITGFLIFDGETFLQILEGVRSQVEITYRRISADPRHHNATTLLARQIDQRDFVDWGMGGLLQTLQIPPGISGEEVVSLAKSKASSKGGLNDPVPGTVRTEL